MRIRSLIIAGLSFLLIGSVLLLPSQGKDKPKPKKKKDDPKQLAIQAREVLTTHCYRCHGQNSSNEGQFNYVLDFKKLLEKKVKAGNAERSRLYRRMAISEDMPPEDVKPRPTKKEIEIIEKWINAGAPIPPEDVEKPRSFVSLKDELEAMQQYLRKAERDERKFIRFFTFRHLHNSPDKRNRDIRVYQAALAKLINSLSWKKDIVVPVPVDVNKTVMAIDLRDLDWDRKSLWKSILKRYPYGLKHDQYPDNKDINDLAEEIYDRAETRIPAIRADWFISTASRPPLYHILLQLPTDAKVLEDRLKVDVKRNFLRGEVHRAGFNASGVSNSNRLVERHDALHGAYWKSYDFLTSVGLGNLFVYPLGPDFHGNPFQRQAFRHDGGEIIFNLPNGFQGYMLVDAKDKRIDEGPIKVVHDRTKVSGTPLVVNGLSCMACHMHGMIRFKDQIRAGHILGGDPRKFLKRIYPEVSEMDRNLDKDEARFLRALEESTGEFLRVGKDKDLKITEFPEPISAIARWYITEELTVKDVSRELGLKDSRQLEGAISANRRLQELGLFPLSRGKKIKRELWEHTEFLLSPYQEAAAQLKLGTPVR